MAKYVQTCLLCKQTYEYCGGCSKYKNLPTFMTTFVVKIVETYIK